MAPSGAGGNPERSQHSKANIEESKQTKHRTKEQGPGPIGRKGVPLGEAAHVFVGTFEHTLDGKGRVVLPSTFRTDLNGRGYLSQYENCLGLWTEQGFAEVTSRLIAKIHEGLAPQSARRAFAANAVQVEPDTQGRILLPQRLRDFAGLGKEVVIIGAIDMIEIWNAERWQSLSAEADQSLLATIGLGL